MLRNNYIKKEILLVQNEPCNILPITIISKEYFNVLENCFSIKIAQYLI